MKWRRVVASPMGPLVLVASEIGLCAIKFAGEAGGDVVAEGRSQILDLARAELEAFFSGQLREFTVPLDLAGSEFQQRVWEVLRTIPYGQTISYGEQAAKLGQARAARAVGAANGKNPVPIIVPCHRVIGKNGGLVGYSSGIERKKFLLELEGRFFAEERGL